MFNSLHKFMNIHACEEKKHGIQYVTDSATYRLTNYKMKIRQFYLTVLRNIVRLNHNDCHNNSMLLFWRFYFRRVCDVIAIAI